MLLHILVFTLILQTALEVLESLRNGDFGKCEKHIDTYIENCHKRFPLAVAFKPLIANHVDDVENECNEMNTPAAKSGGDAGSDCPKVSSQQQQQAATPVANGATS